MDEKLRISNLENEVAQLRSLIEKLTVALPTSDRSTETIAAGQNLHDKTTSDIDDSDQEVRSRRRMLGLLGSAAAGAVGATLIGADSAAAAPSNMQTEVANTASVVGTRINYNGSNTDGIVFLAQSGNVYDGVNSTYPAALGGWTTRPQQPNGVYGYTSQASGKGVIGVNAASTPAGGIGVRGVSSAGIGVQGEGIEFGVRGESLSGTGVYGEGVDAGVSGEGTGAGAPGLFGIGDTGVEAWADPNGDGYALAANFSGKASLFLRTTNDFIGSSPKLRPSVRTDAHKVGEIDTDSNGDLWYCAVAGTPGTWRKLTGPSAAGSFHALTPGRVYDSRFSSYAQHGVLENSQHRTISVANSYDPSTGALVTSSFVPAGAVAVFANVTVTNTVNYGWLAINPGGDTAVRASAINWTASGLTIANGISLTLDGARQITVVNESGGSADFIIDITGYYL